MSMALSRHKGRGEEERGGKWKSIKRQKIKLDEKKSINSCQIKQSAYIKHISLSCVQATSTMCVYGNHCSIEKSKEWFYVSYMTVIHCNAALKGVWNYTARHLHKVFMSG